MNRLQNDSLCRVIDIVYRIATDRPVKLAREMLQDDLDTVIMLARRDWDATSPEPAHDKSLAICNWANRKRGR